MNKEFTNKIIIGAIMLIIVTAGAVKVFNEPDVIIEKETIRELGADTQLFVGGTVYRLAGSGISSSDTSINLASFTIPQTGQEIVDSDLSDTFYITIEPGNTTRQEFVSCTTVTQGAGTAATLSGCTRGLSPISPYTASTTLQFSHAGGSAVIISNPPQLFDQAAFKGNDETITGLWEFTGELPRSSVSATTSTQLTNKTYVDSVANAGAATSTQTNGGIVELATAIEAASSTDDGTGNKPLALWAGIATSSPDQTNTGPLVVVSNTARKIAQAWLNLTEHFSFTSLFATNASTTNATTTSFAVTGAGTHLNGVDYTWPSSEGASSTVISTNGSGSLSWNTLSTLHDSSNLLLATTTASTVNDDTTEQTAFTYSLAGGTLSTDNVVKVKFAISDLDLDHTPSGNSETITFRVKYGATTMHTIQFTTISNASADNMTGYIEFDLIADGGTSSQASTLTIFANENSTTPATDEITINNVSIGSASIDSTTAQNIVITGQVSVDDADNAGFTIDNGIVEILR